MTNRKIGKWCILISLTAILTVTIVLTKHSFRWQQVTGTEETTILLPGKEQIEKKGLIVKEESRTEIPKIEQISEDSTDLKIPETVSLTLDQRKAIQSHYEKVSTNRQKVIQVAVSLIGKVPYEWGGKSKQKGMDSTWGQIIDEQTGQQRGLDCSGFVQWVFRTADYNDRTWEYINCTANILQNCWEIQQDDLIPGDLGLLNEGKTINHVGIYLGDGLWVHCSSAADSVTINDFHFVFFRRVPTIDEESLVAPELMVPEDEKYTLADVCPESISYWDKEKNYPLTPDAIFCDSMKEFWWKCSEGHSWEITVKDFVNAPYCKKCKEM